jgi:hypothetical protein
MKEWILSRRDQTKVAWHEVPGNKRKVEPVPKGLDASFFFFSKHFVPGYPRFNPSGINA